MEAVLGCYLCYQITDHVIIIPQTRAFSGTDSLDTLESLFFLVHHRTCNTKGFREQRCHLKDGHIVKFVEKGNQDTLAQPVRSCSACSVPCYKQHKNHSCSASAKTRKDSDTSGCAGAMKSNESPCERTASPIFSIPASTSLSVPPLAPTRETTDGIETIHDQRSGRAASTSADNERQPSLSPSSTGSMEALQPELRSQSDLGRGDASHVRQGQLDKKCSSATTLECSPPGDGHGELEDDSELGALKTRSQTRKQPQPTPERENALSPSPPPKPHPLRSLTTLKWPYVPDTPSYDDPLTRDDPKPLTLPQYEAIARSPAIRSLLSSDFSSKPDPGTGDRLRELLREIDKLRGEPRERAIERVLGVTPEQSGVFSLAGSGASSSPILATQNQNTRARIGEKGLIVDEEDMRALRKLAEAVEAAVRNADNPNARLRPDPLGLDWESMEA